MNHPLCLIQKKSARKSTIEQEKISDYKGITLEDEVHSRG